MGKTVFVFLILLIAGSISQEIHNNTIVTSRDTRAICPSYFTRIGLFSNTNGANVVPSPFTAIDCVGGACGSLPNGPDLNHNAFGGRFVYMAVVKENICPQDYLLQTKNVVTDLFFIEGEFNNCPGYTTYPEGEGRYDLNAGNSGAYIYMCIQWGLPSNSRIVTYMQIGSNGAGSTLQKVDYTSIDLNLGAFGGDKIWYYRQDGACVGGCQNGGVCDAASNVCRCHDRWGGVNCQIYLCPGYPQNECNLLGRCNTPKRRCDCFNGYKLDASGTCVDLNECIENAQYWCGNSSTATDRKCVNTIGSYDCVSTLSVTKVKCKGGRDGQIQLLFATRSGSSFITSATGITASIANSSHTGPFGLFKGMTAGSYKINIVSSRTSFIYPNNTFVVVTEPVLPSVGVAEYGNPKCVGENGFIRLSPYGGTPPYFYVLQDGTTRNDARFDAKAGDYSILVRDANGCSANTNATVFLTNPLPLDLTFQTTNPSCRGDDGTIVATSSGGTGLYQYRVPELSIVYVSSNNFTIKAGSYRIQVQDSFQCTTTQDFIISEPSTLFAIAPTFVAPTCFGDNDGKIRLNPTNGVAPYSLIIDSITFGTNTNQEGFAAGEYNVTGTDANGCVKSTQLDLVGHDPIRPSVTQITHPLCTASASGKVALTATGGVAPYRFATTVGDLIVGNSSASLKNLPQGTDDNSCYNSIQVTLTDPEVLDCTPQPIPFAPESLWADVPHVAPLKMNISWTPSITYGSAVIYYVVQYSVNNFTTTKYVPHNASLSVISTFIEAFADLEYEISVSPVNEEGEGQKTVIRYVVQVPPIYAPTVPILGSLTFYQIAHEKYASFFISWYADIASVTVTHQIVQSCRVANDFDLSTLSSNPQLEWDTLATVYSSYYPSDDTLAGASTYALLPSGYVYLIRVVTYNSAGAGPASTVVKLIALSVPTIQPELFVFTIPEQREGKTQTVKSSWEVGVDDSNEPSIFYELQVSYTGPTTEQQWLSVRNVTNDNNTEVLDINLELELQQTLYAKNIAGSSYTTRSYKPVVSPDSVKNVTFVDLTPEIFKFSFELPISDGGAKLVGYNVTINVTYSDRTSDEFSLYSTNFDVFFDVNSNNKWMFINVPTFPFATYSIFVDCVNLGGCVSN